MCMRSGFIWMKCMCVFDSRPGQEFWAHRVQGTHRSTLAKAGPASRKGAGDEAPPGDKAREHVIRATTIDAHGLTCKHGGAPVAGGGALLCWGSRMTRKRQACAKEKPTCVIPNVWWLMQRYHRPATPLTADTGPAVRRGALIIAKSPIA